MANVTVEGSSSADAMENPQAYKLLLSCPRGISRHQISVDFQDSCDRVPHPDFNLEISVYESWDKRVQLNASPYNGTKFKYGGYSVRGENDSLGDHFPCLRLGLMDYRCQHMSSPLGNAAVVGTSHNKILSLQRSNNVGEFPGHFVFPGVHPEPNEFGILSHQCAKNVDPGSLKKKISEEMFDSIVHEIMEVPAVSLSDPICMGISSRKMKMRPAAFFFLQCNLPSKDIPHFYATAQDGYESIKLFGVSKRI